MKTYIWKYAYLTFVCNADNIELSRSTFNETFNLYAGKEGLEPAEMETISKVINQQEPNAVLEDYLCALLTRTKD